MHLLFMRRRPSALNLHNIDNIQLSGHTDKIEVMLYNVHWPHTMVLLWQKRAGRTQVCSLLQNLSDALDERNNLVFKTLVHSFTIYTIKSSISGSINNLNINTCTPNCFLMHVQLLYRLSPRSLYMGTRGPKGLIILYSDRCMDEICWGLYIGTSQYNQSDSTIYPKHTISAAEIWSAYSVIPRESSSGNSRFT